MLSSSFYSTYDSHCLVAAAEESSFVERPPFSMAPALLLRFSLT